MKRMMGFIFTMLTFFMLTVGLARAQVCIEDVKHNLWNYRLIYEDDALEVPHVVLIYFHGDGHNGAANTLSQMKYLADADGVPLFAQKERDWMGRNVICICPQGHQNRDFRDHLGNMYAFIKDMVDMYADDETVVLLAGHSNGAIALYGLACEYPEIDVDGWVFLSGGTPSYNLSLPALENVFLYYARNEKMYARAWDFETLFSQKPIYELYDEDTNNLFATHRTWSHGQTPRILLDDLFWDWVMEVESRKEASLSTGQAP